MASKNTRLKSLEAHINELKTGIKHIDPPFPAQAGFITDPSKLKVVLCTRRSGKSYGAGLYLCKAALDTPGASCLYIALTRDSAKKILWKDVLKTINKKYRLSAKFNETELSMTLPNGSIIYLLGVDTTEEERAKLLGQKYALVIIDECAAFTIDLNDLVYSTLKPAVADYRGVICMIGTPGNIKKGLYYDLSRDQDPGIAGTWSLMGWSGHKWSALDNPWMRDNWLAEIADLRAANPDIEELASFQQQYLGRWTVDENKLVYRYKASRNDFDGVLPAPTKGQWRYVLGIDLGYTDASAFSVCAYHDHLKELRVVESTKQAKLDVSQVAQRIQHLMNRFNIETLIVDNANKQAVVEMQNRYGLPLIAADKRGKADFIELMNADFITHKIFLGPDTEALKKEYQGLVWGAPTASGLRRESPGCENHCTDATLYAWRYCYGYLSDNIIPKPDIGTLDWYAQEALAIERLEEDRLQEWQDEHRPKEGIEIDPFQYF